MNGQSSATEQVPGISFTEQDHRAIRLTHEALPSYGMRLELDTDMEDLSPEVLCIIPRPYEPAAFLVWRTPNGIQMTDHRDLRQPRMVMWDETIEEALAWAASALGVAANPVAASGRTQLFERLSKRWMTKVTEQSAPGSVER